MSSGDSVLALLGSLSAGALGTFFGAFLAFWFERAARTKEREDREATALWIAYSSLVHQRDLLQAVQRDALSLKPKGSAERDIADFGPPLQMILRVVDIRSLEFMVGVSGGPRLLQRLGTIQASVNQLAYVLDQRESLRRAFIDGQIIRRLGEEESVAVPPRLTNLTTTVDEIMAYVMGHNRALCADLEAFIRNEYPRSRRVLVSSRKADDETGPEHFN